MVEKYQKKCLQISKSGDDYYYKVYMSMAYCLLIEILIKGSQMYLQPHYGIWSFQQCLPYNWTTPRDKHWRHSITVMGIPVMGITVIGITVMGTTLPPVAALVLNIGGR